MNPDENQLISKLRKGDQPAFRQLVDLYQEKILNTCLGFVSNLHDAEDITQEVFIEVFRSIEKFKGEAKLSTWVYRIAVNKSLAHIRRNKRAKRKAFLQSLTGLDKHKNSLGSTSFYHPGVDLENQERAKILFTAIEGLSENQRIAFTLHKIEGLSYQDIAVVMEASLSSVESLIFRARKNLQKKLFNYYKNRET